MPPKAKYTKEEIIDAAYEIARKEGPDNVAARAVGKRLNTSSTPIFTFFNSMDELKAEVIKKAESEYIRYMDGVLDYPLAFKEYGLRWIRYAKENPKIYRLLFLGTNNAVSLYRDSFRELLDPIIGTITETFDIDYADAKMLFNQMVIYSHGLADFCISNPDLFTDEQINSGLSRICTSLATGIKISNGTVNMDETQKMIKQTFNTAKKG